MGKSGINYSAQSVSMNLADDVDEFTICLGQGFNLHAALSERQKTKKIKLYMGQQCILDKTL